MSPVTNLFSLLTTSTHLPLQAACFGLKAVFLCLGCGDQPLACGAEVTNVLIIVSYSKCDNPAAFFSQTKLFAFEMH